MGCPLGKAIQAPVQMSTGTRAVKLFARLLVDLSGKIRVPSFSGMWCILIVRDEYSRWTRVFFLRKKSDAAKAFEMILAECRHLGFPVGMIELFVRSDDGGELSAKAFRALRRRWGIKQEFTPYGKNNGVAKHTLRMIQDVARASRAPGCIHVPLCPDPGGGGLWAEAVACACHSMEYTPTTPNPGNKSPWGDTSRS